MGRLNRFGCELDFFFGSLFGAGTEFHFTHVTQMFEGENLGLIPLKGDGFSVKEGIDEFVPFITAHSLVFGLCACGGERQ